MFSNPEPQRQALRAPAPIRAALQIGLALLASTWLVACTTGPDRAVDPGLAQVATPSPATVAALACQARAPLTAESCVLSAANETIARLLAYADRVRLIPAADLGPEIARLGDAATPSSQVQLALLLVQYHQLPELIRAQETLARVLGNSSLEAQSLHPMARLLATRFGDQRRLEEQLDKQNQQTREVQRRLDQTNERLEALKAIERSLASRPAAATPGASPANRRALTP